MFNVFVMKKQFMLNIYKNLYTMQPDYRKKPIKIDDLQYFA